jgi:hypothetical protein
MPAETDANFATLHDSSHLHARTPLHSVTATPRGRGALRYRCPATGSFVLVTDEATLQRLARPQATLRCPDCGEKHLLSIAGDAAIVAQADHRR